MDGGLLRPLRVQILAGFTLALLLTSLSVAAQSLDGAGTESAPDSSPTSVVPQDSHATAPVVVDGRTLFEVRGVPSYPAEKRAGETVEQIIAAAKDDGLSTEMLRVEPGEHGDEIRIGDLLLMTIVASDAKLAGVRRPVLIEARMEVVRVAIDAYREDRTQKKLLQNALHAILGTALFVGLIVGLRWVRNKLRSVYETRYKPRLDEMEQKSRKVLKAEQLWDAIQVTRKILSLIIVLVAAYVYINSVLLLFPWTRGLANRLLEYLLAPLKAIGEGLLGFLPNLFFLAVLFFLVRYSLQALQGLSSAVSKGQISFKGFEIDWAWPTYRIVRIVVIAFGLVVAYPYIPGSQSDAFKAMTLFIGVVFSLGSSSFISNIIAGYMLTYRRAFRLGDIIKVGDVTGEVVDRHILETHLRTFKNEEVVLPNSAITNGQVTNYSVRAKREGLVLYTTVGIGYEVPWRQVKAMLLMAATRTKGITTSREPFVRQKSLGDFGVNYEINVYCDTPGKMPALYTALHENIQDVFNEYGVPIMTPAYMADPEEPKFVPRDKWYEAPATPPGTQSKP